MIIKQNVKAVTMKPKRIITLFGENLKLGILGESRIFKL